MDTAALRSRTVTGASGMARNGPLRSIRPVLNATSAAPSIACGSRLGQTGMQRARIPALGRTQFAFNGPATSTVAIAPSITVFHNPSSEKGLRIELKGCLSAFQEQKSPSVMAGIQRVTTLSGVTMGRRESNPRHANYDDAEHFQTMRLTMCIRYFYLDTSLKKSPMTQILIQSRRFHDPRPEEQQGPP